MPEASERGERQNKQQDIINVATALFVEKGVKNTSLADIAEAAGISKGTLYYYYSSKNDLVFDITVTHIDTMTDQLIAHMRQGKVERSARHIFIALLEELEKNDILSKLRLYLVQEALTSNESLKDKFRKTYHKWHMMVDETLVKLLPENENHEVLAQILVALWEGVMFQSLMGVELKSKEMVEYLLKPKK